MKKGEALDKAIDRLADKIEDGHLLASMGGEDLLIAAADRIAELEHEARKLRERVSSFELAAKDCAQGHEWLQANLPTAGTRRPVAQHRGVK